MNKLWVIRCSIIFWALYIPSQPEPKSSENTNSYNNDSIDNTIHSNSTPLTLYDNSSSDENVEMLLAKSVEFIETNKFPEAIELLRKTELIIPENTYMQTLLATALNNYAVASDKTGNHSRAIELIEEAYVLTPTTEVKNNYITLLLNYANNCRTLQQWSDALNTYSYLYSLTSKDSVALQISNTYAEWGRALMETGNADKASDKFLDALTFNANNEQALFYLANTAYQKQDIDQAYFYWQRLAEISPNDLDVKNFLDRLSRERDISHNLTHTSEDYFEIHYDNSSEIDPQLLKHVSDSFRNAYNTLGARFSFYPQEKIIVLLLNEKQFEYTTNLPHWVAGIYDGKIRIPITDDFQQMEETILHEYVHLLIHHLGKGNVPRWLNEGFAEYFSSKKHHYENIKALIKQNEFMPISQLDTAITGGNTPQTMITAYEEAALCIAFFYEKYSMHKLKQMIGEFADAQSFSTILQTTFGLSEKEFEENFKKYAKNELLTRAEQKQLRFRIKQAD